MANIDSATLNDNGYMQAFGNAVVATGSVAVTTPSDNDVIRIMKIPAGSRVSALIIANADLDSNGSPALAGSIGYAPVVSGDGPTASAAYFAADGQTVLQAANDGKLYAKFAPVTFEKDVYLTFTVTEPAATFAAGSIYAVALGTARGVK
jgi:hypothetical protein